MNRTPVTIRRAMLALAGLSLVTAVAAAGDSAALWTNDVLVRPESIQGPQSSLLNIRILTPENPVLGWVNAVVPGTDDAAYDGEPAVGIQPATDLESQRIAVVWVREDASLGQRDLAMIWMDLPAWEGSLQWVTRTTSTPQDPRLLVLPNGNQAILYRRAEDGHLIYMLRNRTGSSREVLDLAPRMGNRGVAEGAYDWALIGDEIIVAATPNDGSGEVLVLADGELPTGGDWLPVPLFRDQFVFSSSGSAYQFNERDGIPAPRVDAVGEKVLVSWVLMDPDLDQETLLFRYRDSEGSWSDWSRMALDAEYTQAEALEVLRGLLTRNATDGNGLGFYSGELFHPLSQETDSVQSVSDTDASDRGARR